MHPEVIPKDQLWTLGGLSLGAHITMATEEMPLAAGLHGNQWPMTYGTCPLTCHRDTVFTPKGALLICPCLLQSAQHFSASWRVGRAAPSSALEDDRNGG